MLGIKFAKVLDVKSPNRGTKRSAGLDIYVPKFNEDFVNDLYSMNNIVDTKDDFDFLNEEIKLKSGGSILVPSGLHFRIPEGCALITDNKSGVASKNKVSVLAKVIDEDFTGQYFVSIINLSKKPFIIKPGMKLVQVVQYEVGMEDPEEFFTLEKLYGGYVSERGSGSRGSTGV